MSEPEVAAVPTETEEKAKRTWSRRPISTDPLEGADSDLRAQLMISREMNGLRHDAPRKVAMWFYERYVKRYLEKGADAEAPKA